MKFIKEFIKRRKEKNKRKDLKEMRKEHDRKLKEYEDKYNNRHVLISNGLKGKICGVRISNGFSGYFGYMSFITHISVMIDRKKYKISVDDIIGVEQHG